MSASLGHQGGGGEGGLSDFGQKAIRAAVREGMVFRGI